MKKNHSAIFSVVSLVALLVSGSAFAAGFEKVTEWSGHYDGLAGAGVSNSSGAESLYFNPAGMADGDTQVSLNFSPTFSQFSGPFYAGGAPVDSNRTFSPEFGVLGNYKVSDKLGVGVGVYVAGGTRAIYDSVDFSGVPGVGAAYAGLKPPIKSDLNIIEAALGAGYEVMPGLKIGAAWRVVMVHANLDTAFAVPTSPFPLVAAQLDSIGDTNWGGFKAGIQYTGADKNWGLGANWRSTVTFNATGTSAGQVVNGTAPAAGTVIPLTGSPVTVTDEFPTQITLGGYYDIVPKVRVIGEYAWTEYSKDQAINISGGTLTGYAVPLALPSIPVNFQNMWNGRLAVECTEVENWAFRAGYAYTSQVTPLGSARATISSPGSANTFTVGVGNTFSKAWEGNFAFEYSSASGTVTTEGPAPGDYKSNAYVFHLGATYHL